MGRIRKLKSKEFIGGKGEEDIYPITSTKAVFNTKDVDLDNILLSLDTRVLTNSTNINKLKNDCLSINDNTLILSKEQQIAVKKKLDIKEGGGGGVVLPVVISEIVSNVDIISENTKLDGVLVYDTTSGYFLWKVGDAFPYTYYNASEKEPIVGTTPSQGQLYINGTKTFIGVYKGLFQLHKSNII